MYFFVYPFLRLPFFSSIFFRTCSFSSALFCYDTVLCSVMIRASARPAFMRKASAGRGDRPAGSVCRSVRHGLSNPQPGPAQAHVPTQGPARTQSVQINDIVAQARPGPYNTGCPINKSTQAFGSCSRTRVPILFKLTMDIV